MKAKESRVKIPVLHPAQKAIDNEAKRYNVAAMGRRWGKSKFGTVKMLMGENGIFAGYPAGWFAPSSRYVEEIWDEIVSRCDDIIIGKNKQLGRIKFIGGGSLDFWAAGEDPNVARGRRYSRVIIDEAAHIRYLREAWERAIVPTLTDYKGEAWFISTPNGMNYFHELWQRGLDGSSPDWKSWQMPTMSNPYISRDEVESKKTELPHLVYLQEYEAQFVTFGGGMVKPDMIRIAPCPAGLPVHLGVDLAISTKDGADYTGIVAASMDDDSGMLYVREVSRGRWTFNQSLEEIKRVASRWDAAKIQVEQTQYQAAVVQELLRTTGLPVFGIRPDKDKITRFYPVLARYEQNMVRHDPAIQSWFRDEILSFPSGEHDDIVDALCYAAHSLLSGRELKPFSATWI